MKEVDYLHGMLRSMQGQTTVARPAHLLKRFSYGGFLEGST